MKSENELLLLV